jgi:ribose transport system ATP-binding protein
MLLSEPTQGVDIGARREIFKLIRSAVAEGMTVLCATSDYEQLVEMADRVVVINAGRVQSEIRGDDITKDALASAVYAEEAS